MEFHGHDTHPGVIVLVADKQLDSYDSAGLVADLQRAIDAGAHTLVVDCSRLGHVSTIAVCALLTLHKRMVEHGSELRLAAVKPPLLRVLSLTRLDQVFRLFASVDEAVEATRPPAATTAAPRRA